MTARAAANALRKQCHFNISAMGPATPPEIFVYRGNAYMELDQPYFAKADFNNAAKVMRLSGTHHEKCDAKLQSMQGLLKGSYPSVDVHLPLHVLPLLGDHVELRHMSDAMGRGVVATAPLNQNHIVVKRCDPFLSYPLKEGYCSYCCKKLGVRVFACQNERCHEEYCSRDCRHAALSSYHGKVCTNEPFQGIELEMFRRMNESTDPHEKNILAGQLLLMRVLAVSLLASAIPTSIPEVRTLSGRIQFQASELGGPMLEFYEQLARFGGFATSIFYEEFIGVYARVLCNSFKTEESIFINLPRSMLNHSCESNVALDASGQELVTTRKVSPGTELTLNYFPQLQHLPNAERTEELRKRNFDCFCAKCSGGK